jgi:hypothetical protein
MLRHESPIIARRMTLPFVRLRRMLLANQSSYQRSRERNTFQQKDLRQFLGHNALFALKAFRQKLQQSLKRQVLCADEQDT